MKVVVAFFLAGSLFALDAVAQDPGKTEVENKAAAGGGKAEVGVTGAAGDRAAPGAAMAGASGGSTATAVAVGAAAASMIAFALGRSAPEAQRK